MIFVLELWILQSCDFCQICFLTEAFVVKSWLSAIKSEILQNYDCFKKSNQITTFCCKSTKLFEKNFSELCRKTLILFLFCSFAAFRPKISSSAAVWDSHHESSCCGVCRCERRIGLLSPAARQMSCGPHPAPGPHPGPGGAEPGPVLNRQWHHSSSSHKHTADGSLVLRNVSPTEIKTFRAESRSVSLFLCQRSNITSNSHDLSPDLRGSEFHLFISVFHWFSWFMFVKVKTNKEIKIRPPVRLPADREEPGVTMETEAACRRPPTHSSVRCDLCKNVRTRTASKSVEKQETQPEITEPVHIWTGFCRPGSADQVLQTRFCRPGSADQVLQTRFCRPGFADQVL